MVRNPGIWQEAVNGVESIFRVIQGMHAVYTLSFCFHICKFGTVLAWSGLDSAEG